jgi:hypothetical protein
VFKLDSETALLDTFRPRDRKLVEPPPGLKYPLIATDYFSWLHPAGGRVFAVFAPRGGGLTTGIVFDTNGANHVTQLCHWCHSQSNDVAMLTAQRNSNKRIGVCVCSDLSCARKIEDAANLSGRSVRPAMEALVARMVAFARDGLNIDFTRR